MALPTQVTPANIGFSGKTTLLYGYVKTGKSTFCTKLDNPIMLDMSNEYASLTTAKINIDCFEKIEAAYDDLKNEKHSYKTVVIDTIDVMYQYAAAQICKDKGIKDEADIAHGKAYGLLKNLVYRTALKFHMLPMTVVFVGNVFDEITNKKSGDKITESIKKVPLITRKLKASTIDGLLDYIFFCDMEKYIDPLDKQVKTKTVMRTKPSVDYVAGDKTGLLPDKIDMDYEALKQAFSNIKKETK